MRLSGRARHDRQHMAAELINIRRIGRANARSEMAKHRLTTDTMPLPVDGGDGLGSTKPAPEPHLGGVRAQDLMVVLEGRSTNVMLQIGGDELSTGEAIRTRHRRPSRQEGSLKTD